MLKKILEDMFVPDEILNNISDDDKQLIFIEIRKEQIRRYNLWQSSDKSSEEFHHKPNFKGKNITFVDDCELVSFLGERPFDRPIEDILKEEAFMRAQKEAELVVLAELGVSTPEKGDVSKNIDTVDSPIEVPTKPSNVSVTVAPTVDQVSKSPPAKAPKPIAKRPSKGSDLKRDELMKRKSTEIYHTLISQQSVLEETALKENEELTPIWEKQEEQARTEEEQRRKKAIEARKFYANIGKERISDANEFGLSAEIVPPPPPVQKSSQLRYVLDAISNFEISNKTVKDKGDIKAWFLENEWNKKRIVDKITNKVPEWFHGMITRQQAEKYLSDKDMGSFLIRVSEKCFCYVLSFRGKTKIKHILIESKIESDQYQFVGPSNKIVFKCLQDLITHFQSNYISDSNHDMLTQPCGQSPDSVVDYMSLIQPDSSHGDKKTTLHKCPV